MVSFVYSMSIALIYQYSILIKERALKKGNNSQHFLCTHAMGLGRSVHGCSTWNLERSTQSLDKSYRKAWQSVKPENADGIIYSLLEVTIMSKQ